MTKTDEKIRHCNINLKQFVCKKIRSKHAVTGEQQ
jgi:hypothetical protein